MVVIDALEGNISFSSGVIWFHYDVSGDVLYLRRSDRRAARAVGEETDEGFILLRDEETDQPIGLTVVDWWKRFGQGELPDSLDQIQRRIEPLAKGLAA